jgi:2-polyprenyl-6-methoxyphenol hydroxylase-like FAD-dependent oxidoreductase
MSTATPSVLVIGAGPVGLAAAIELTRLGARVRIIEQRDCRTTESRAIAVNPRTLALLEDSGATSRLIAAGVRLRGLRVFTRGRHVASVDLSRIRHRYPFLLALPQSETERILEERLTELGVTVTRGTRLADLELGARVEAVLEGAVAQTATADWIVGADGAHSIVRKEIGSGFPGERYPFQWSLADVTLAGDVELDRGELHLDPGRPILFRLPLGEGRHRVISNSPDVVGRLPRTWSLGEVVWQSDFIVSHRLADRIVAGRAVIIGDAAHIHSPAGGRGMNLGIEDAATLAPRIMAGELGDWPEQRRARAAQVVRESDRLQNMATASGVLSRTFVPLVAAVGTRIPWLHDAFVQQIAGAGSALAPAAHSQAAKLA